MIQIKDQKTLNIFETFDHLGSKPRKLMEQSWASLFHEEIPTPSFHSADRSIILSTGWRIDEKTLYAARSDAVTTDLQ